MSLIIFLIIFPLVIAFLMLLFKNNSLRSFLVTSAVAVLCFASILLLVKNYHKGAVYFSLESPIIDKVIFGFEIIVGLYILYQSLRFKKPLITLLILAQLGIMSFLEFVYAHKVTAEHNLFVDRFSIIMALIIGVIGSLICLYALGYMKELHTQHSHDLKDNRKNFFFLMFLFLSAMFGVVFSNNMVWLYFFWEITTLCSFLLIRYKENEESIKNAFHALTLNLVGGLAFACAIAYLYKYLGVIELDKILATGKALVLVPVVLISISGLTKSAQFPFSSWLLGAMVAPTPVSALLHSSTMVKAGVYIIVKFASLLQGTTAGFIIAMIGAVTFFITALITITHSDAKRILAYSTISNLGLIVLCAGVGTPEAVWAAILLIIFHAISKCLLFLCVGTVEHKIHSRNLEDMSALIIKMPKLSIMMQIGMAGMFLAPFGMLIGKWAVIKALVDYNPLLVILVVFGGAATLFFWVKWMGKLIIVVDESKSVEENVSWSERIPLKLLAFFTIVISGLFPWVSNVLISPYLVEIYGRNVSMNQGNIIIMSVMLVMFMLFPVCFFFYGRDVKVVQPYLGGANIESTNNFIGAAQATKQMVMNNYYLEKYFGEQKLFKYGVVISIVFIAMMFAGLCL